MISHKRWLRNKRDGHDKNTRFDLERFGVQRRLNNMIIKYTDPTKPSYIFGTCIGCYNAPTLLDPSYTVDELRTLYALAKRKKVNKKDFGPNQTVFSPRIALYLIFMSEDDILERYIRYWKKYKCVPLKIPSDLITPDLRPGCSCYGCFGQCVRIADGYKLLPDKTDHEQMEIERNRVMPND